MTEETYSVAWVIVGWIAFGLGQVMTHRPFAKLFLLAMARVLP